MCAVDFSTCAGAGIHRYPISTSALPMTIVSIQFLNAADISHSKDEATMFFNTLKRVRVRLFSLGSTLLNI